MKSLLIMSLACLAVLIGFSNSSYAQKQLQDSLWAFSEPLQLESGGKELMGRQELKFKIKTPEGIVPIPPELAKAIAVPSGARIALKPLLISAFINKNENCWQYTCTDRCKECYLLWYDRNGDNEVQPHWELRCVTRQFKTLPIRVEKIECE